MKIKNEDHEHQDETIEEEGSIIIPNSPESRLLGLYGSINEDKIANLIGLLYHLKQTGEEVLLSENEGESKILYKPIEFLISTEGGSVAEMFSLYDVIRDIQKYCEISTFAVGKCMSAGILLIAGGTKGKRKAGRNCRFMIHSISSGHYGQLHSLQNNFQEVNALQESYIKELCLLTNLTPKKLKNIFNKRIDFFFSAEEALKFGIIDEIV